MSYGPWSPAKIEPAERKAQFRSLAALAAVFFGSSHRLVDELRNAESDADAAARAFDLLDVMPTLTRRKMFSVFSSITWRRPPRPPRRPYRPDIDEREPVGRFSDLTAGAP